MKKRLLSIIVLSLLSSSCASLNSNATNLEKHPSLKDYSEYTSSAIADWILEEAKSKQLETVILRTNQDDYAFEEIQKRLINNNIKITKDANNEAFDISYSISEIDDNILIKISSKEYEVSRLFKKSDGNSIIPASPLSMRANP